VQVCITVVQKIEHVFEDTVETWIKKVDKVCEDLPWPLDWFCHLVTTVVKIVETIVKTVIETAVTVVCYPITLAVTLIAEVLQLVFLIPIIGPLVKWWVGAVVWLWSQWIGLWDAAAGLVGIRPIKHLRLEVIILMHEDRTLTAAGGVVAPLVTETESIYRARADVKIHTTVHQVDTPSPSGALTIDTSIDPFFGLLGEDLTEAGAYFQTTITEMLWEDNPWFAIRVGAPIVVFVVDQVEGTYAGCSAGPLLDYICVEGSAFGAPGTLLGHEMGHACGLQHDKVWDCDDGDVTNLMYCKGSKAGVGRGENLSPFQRAIVRSSPHVTYI
jgi:hypothetical protein